MWRRYVGVHLSPFIAVNSQDDCERLIVEKFDAQIRRAVCSSRGEFPSRQTAAVPSDETEEGGTKVVEVSSFKFHVDTAPTPTKLHNTNRP